MKRVESDKLSPLPMITDKQLIDFHKYYVSQHGTGIVEANDFIHEIREYFRLSNTEPTGRDIGRLEDFRKHFLLGRLARDEGSFCLSECILKSANIILEGTFKESFFTEKVDEINRAIELYEEMLSDYVNPNKFPEALVKIVNGKIDESTLKSRLVRPY